MKVFYALFGLFMALFVNLQATVLDSLPVNFVAFTAEVHGDQIVLEWETAGTDYPDFFDIELWRPNYETEQNPVPGDTTTGYWAKDLENRKYPIFQESATYRHSYKPKDVGQHFFRITQTDYDGGTVSSEIKEVNFYPATLEVYPNPVSDYIQFNIRVDWSEVVLPNGQSFTLSTDDTGKAMLPSELATGAYLIRARSGDLHKTFRILKE